MTDTKQPKSKIFNIPNVNSRPKNELQRDFESTFDAIAEFVDLANRMKQHLDNGPKISQDDYELACCAIYYFWEGWQKALTAAEEAREEDSVEPIIQEKTKTIILPH